MKTIQNTLLLATLTWSLTCGFLVMESRGRKRSPHRPPPSTPPTETCAITFLWSTPGTSSSSIEQDEAQINPRLSGLALQLDAGTRKSHSMAQNSAFVSGFFKGLSTKESYRDLITSLYFVYREMEQTFDQTTICPAPVQMLDDPELRRMVPLEQDMDYFYGRDWKSTIRPSAATKVYLSRIQTIAQDPNQSYLLVAHQYTRYLGDLFGGQMMGGMARRSLDLKDGQGTAFYTFDDIPSAKDYITEWYTRLNALDLTEKQKEKIVDEANLVFDLNIGILQELDGSPLLAVWTLAINTLRMKLGLSR